MMSNGVTTGTWPRILGSHLVVLPGPDRIDLKTRRCNGRWNWPRPWHTGAEGHGGFPRGMLFFGGGSEKHEKPTRIPFSKGITRCLQVSVIILG